MAEGLIKWNKQDENKLKKAVNDFNRKITELQKEEKRLYLPEKVKYSNLQQNITTRRELNRKLESLERFMKEGAEKVYINKAGAKITVWERGELQRESNIARRRLEQEKAALNIPKYGQAYSRVRMGSEREKEINKELENLKEIETKKGYDFKRRKEIIHAIGTSDYNMKRSIVYRQNYIEEMKKYSNYENYDKLEAMMNRVTNPLEFYKRMSVNELTKDLTYQSDQVLSQEEFNKFLNELGIETEDIQTDSESQKRYIFNELDVAEYQENKRKGE